MLLPRPSQPPPRRLERFGAPLWPGPTRPACAEPGPPLPPRQLLAARGSEAPRTDMQWDAVNGALRYSGPQESTPPLSGPTSTSS
eukprot:3214231-Pyramimonas_sp.AAC.1